MRYPEDQSYVIFKNLDGINREGKYVLALQAFVESIGDEGPEDDSNIVPQAKVVQWGYLDRSEMDGGLVEAF